MKLPLGMRCPSALVKALFITRESEAVPSQPVTTYVNFISNEHAANTFCVAQFFLPQYLGASYEDTLTRTWVPSIVPIQSYNIYNFYDDDNTRVIIYLII